VEARQQDKACGREFINAGIPSFGFLPDAFRVYKDILAKEVTSRINNREFTWEGDFIDLHPSPFGQNVYYASISDFLGRCWDQDLPATASDHILPARLDPF